MSMTKTIESNVTAIIPNDDERAFTLLQREATALSNSTLIPKEFQGNVANAMIALNLARRIGADPMMVMQQMDVIHGRPSFRATFLIAAINSCGKFSSLRYRITGEGDDKSCVAYAIDRETGEEIEGPPVSIAMSKAEGWYGKAGSKWKTLTDLMLRYRAAAFFARTTCPELTLGMLTTEELEDIRTDRRPPGASAQRATDALHAARDVTPVEIEEDSQEPEIDPADAAFGLSGEE